VTFFWLRLEQEGSSEYFWTVYDLFSLIYWGSLLWRWSYCGLEHFDHFSKIYQKNCWDLWRRLAFDLWRLIWKPTFPIFHKLFQILFRQLTWYPCSCRSGNWPDLWDNLWYLTCWCLPHELLSGSALRVFLIFLLTGIGLDWKGCALFLDFMRFGWECWWSQFYFVSFYRIDPPLKSKWNLLDYL